MQVPEHAARDEQDLIEAGLGFDSSEKQDESFPGRFEEEDSDSDGSYTRRRALLPDVTSFSLYEKALGPDVHVRGEVHIRPAPPDHGRDTALYFDIDTRLDPSPASGTASQIIHPPSYDDVFTAGKLSVTLSHTRPGNNYVYVTLYLCPGQSLRQLSINTTSLPIVVHPDIHFSITNRWKLSTTAHPITFLPSPSSGRELATTNYSQREIIIYSASGFISGTYPLFDLLSITTVSGTIGIDILPRPALASTPYTPASLVLSSTSGSIHATVLNIHNLRNKIPDRTYASRLNTISGSIAAKLLHTTSTFLSSTSGQLSADIYPTSTSSSHSSKITTTGQSGTTDIIVHPDIFSPQTPIKSISGQHSNTSGSLTVRYPNTWEGKIQARALSGRVGIRWNGVRIIRDWGGKDILAEKGLGQGQLFLNSLSGEIDLGGTAV